jgi:prolyl 4-hydroxylase
MAYLNAVEEGGQTLFHRIGRRYDPLPGFGLAWNNLLDDGTPNPATLHGGVRVDRGSKYIVTKWYRTRPAPHTTADSASQGSS